MMVRWDVTLLMTRCGDGMHSRLNSLVWDSVWRSSWSCVYVTGLISKASWDLLATLGCVQVITKSSEATFQSHNPFDFLPSQGMVLSFAVKISLQIPQIFYRTEVNWFIPLDISFQSHYQQSFAAWQWKPLQTLEDPALFLQVGKIRGSLQRTMS